MSEPIYPQQLVAHFDEDGIELVSTTPGPAGAADLQLNNGVSLLLDFADPGALTSLRVEGESIPETLVELIGEERAERLDSTERNPDTKPLRLATVRMIEDDMPPRIRGSQPRSGTRVAEELGALSRLRSLAEDEEVHDVVRATSALEYLERASRIDDDIPGLIEPDPRLAALASSLLDGEEEGLARLTRSRIKTGMQLASLVWPYQSEYESLRRAHEALVEPSLFEHPISRRKFQVAEASTALSAAHVRDIDASRRITAMELSDGGLLSVQVAHVEESLWLRVTLSGSQSLLAVVPFMDTHEGSKAEAILPPDLSLHDILLEVTRTPVPTARSTIDQVIGAIELGRDAVRRSIVRRSAFSHEAWERCADAWVLLGDEQRATQARRYAMAGLPRDGLSLIMPEVLSVFETDFV